MAPTDQLRAITVRQPWAQLIAAGVKTIETRGRRTKHRGPVAIHAGQRLYTAADKHDDRGLWYEVHDALQLERSGGVYLLPYGAIVAVANLVDCVPMKHSTEPRNGHCLVVGPTGHMILHGDPLEVGRDVSAEHPFGDYRPGRWAYLLDDVRPLAEPVPARGQQAVPWRVPADVVARVREQIEVDAR